MSPSGQARQRTMRRRVFFSLVCATGWFAAVLFAWKNYHWPHPVLAVPLALAPFVVILLWSRRNPRA